MKAQRYELLRFWLLGTWLANEMKRDFCFLLLLREGAEPHIHGNFSGYIRTTDARSFIRVNWEDIHGAAAKQPEPDAALLAYMANKTLGYDTNGNLRRAFSV